MTQYDAGPGDWSDREWEDPEHKQKPQAKRRFALPPWALVTALVAVVILLCVGLIFGVRALGQRGKAANPTPTAVATYGLGAVAETTATPEALVEPSSGFVVTTTLEPGPVITITTPITTVAPAVFTEIAPGATVVVQGTGTRHLRVRAQPSTSAATLTFLTDGTELLVLDGPRTANGYTWWQVRTADQKVTGWAAGEFLALKH